MKWYDEDYINLSKMLTYNAAIYMLDTTRGRGKSWGIFIYAYKHYRRHHRSTILVRRTEDATKKTKEKAYNKKICKAMGWNPDNFRIVGDKAQWKDKREKWHTILEFCTLSKMRDERSADDGQADIMILDEGKVSARERSFFVGDEVSMLLDLWDSKRRGGRMPLIILGNRESTVSPYQAYFGIPPLPVNYNGVRRYRGGSILCAQSTKPAKIASNFDSIARQAMTGTKYDQFAYGGTPNDYDALHVIKRPKVCAYYTSFDFGVPLTAWRWSGGVYFTEGIDESRTIFCDTKNTHKNSLIYDLSMRSRFVWLKKQIQTNRVWYQTEATGAHVGELLQRLRL